MPTAAALDVPFSVRRGADEITTSRARLDVAVVHEFLTESYWSPGISRKRWSVRSTARSISACTA